ncbi:uncharacterized protein LOC113378352 [Ctenocephalides felis]|uniref:uncharacterized protein LOC113363700 n=1 Tax=Ctenocephalides felis TaxID=7515 RepID=UPI000E6E20E8|nr:uncharacterized protein LOC113363700 [Ctenocephalides felis]XP_026468136.1 uncharacterized protein LOC113371719 [Ctenocephalides felis]XP_026469295.1 uncharacterized protein LOC113373200 [Ctenocephalides felis]XP_026474210.1 uncharacterized protein LOC113377956 isoform X2 [Ctenocephalides felis]XP_026474673.1 uncharacterized protein LOC113378352 [Ctenocephalides felis]
MESGPYGEADAQSDDIDSVYKIGISVAGDTSRLLTSETLKNAISKINKMESDLTKVNKKEINSKSKAIKKINHEMLKNAIKQQSNNKTVNDSEGNKKNNTQNWAEEMEEGENNNDQNILEE